MDINQLLYINIINYLKHLQITFKARRFSYSSSVIKHISAPSPSRQHHLSVWLDAWIVFCSVVNEPAVGQQGIDSSLSSPMDFTITDITDGWFADHFCHWFFSQGQNVAQQQRRRNDHINVLWYMQHAGGSILQDSSTRWANGGVRVILTVQGGEILLYVKCLLFIASLVGLCVVSFLRFSFEQTVV